MEEVSKYVCYWKDIILVVIGALIAYIAQWLIENRKEKNVRKNKIHDLYSEIIELSKLLININKLIVMYKVHKSFWYKQFDIHADVEDKLGKAYGNVKANRFYEMHHESNLKSFEELEKKSQYFAKYYKVVQLIRTILDLDDGVIKKLEEYQNYKPRPVKNFNSVNYAELYEAMKKEEHELNNEYAKADYLLNEINDIVFKKLKESMT